MTPAAGQLEFPTRVSFMSKKPAGSLPSSMRSPSSRQAPIRALSDRVTAEVVPRKNTRFTPKHRRKMLGLSTRRLLQQLLG
jgi:hypothetical protein